MVFAILWPGRHLIDQCAVDQRLSSCAGSRRACAALQGAAVLYPGDHIGAVLEQPRQWPRQR